MTLSLPLARELSAYHDAALAASTPVALPRSDPLWEAIANNHACNCGLWAEEDQARRTDVADSEIAKNKRAIDRFNQRRNDATETMDEIILASLVHVQREADAHLNSESAGSMIDRLSIVSLKIHHMRIQAQRSDADEAHRQRCAQRVIILEEQRADLQNAFDALLAQARAGRAYYKIYRQFKMYNDPALNPYLYRARSPDAP